MKATANPISLPASSLELVPVGRIWVTGVLIPGVVAAVLIASVALAHVRVNRAIAERRSIDGQYAALSRENSLLKGREDAVLGDVGRLSTNPYDVETKINALSTALGVALEKVEAPVAMAAMIHPPITAASTGMHLVVSSDRPEALVQFFRSLEGAFPGMSATGSVVSAGNGRLKVTTVYFLPQYELH